MQYFFASSEKSEVSVSANASPAYGNIFTFGDLRGRFMYPFLHRERRCRFVPLRISDTKFNRIKVSWSKSLFKWSCLVNFVHSTELWNLPWQLQARSIWGRCHSNYFKDLGYRPDIWSVNATYSDAVQYHRCQCFVNYCELYTTTMTNINQLHTTLTIYAQGTSQLCLKNSATTCVVWLVWICFCLV